MPKLNISSLWLKRIGMVVTAGIIFAGGWALGTGNLNPNNWHAEQNNLPNSLDYSSVNDVYKALRNNFDGKLDVNTLEDGMKAGLVNAAGDPHTEYMNAAQTKSFNDQLDGSFTGIGAELGMDSHKIIQIISPLAGYPAEKAGVKAQDLVLAIDGKTTNGMTISQAVDKIRGPAGTSVTLLLQRGQEQLAIKITRSNISVPSVSSKVKDGVGYLTISRFGDDTADLTQKAAKGFKDQHVKGVIVDLRGNPGGLLQAAVSVSSLWVPNGKTILTERRDGIVTNTFTATGDTTLAGVPTVVLIDGGSASAAEITAGALHDNGVATLVGQKSYGKGSVQQIVQLGGGAILKVTVARWYTPNGKNIDKAGISPDKSVSAGNDASTDPVVAAALAIINK